MRGHPSQNRLPVEPPLSFSEELYRRATLSRLWSPETTPRKHFVAPGPPAPALTPHAVSVAPPGTCDGAPRHCVQVFRLCIQYGKHLGFLVGGLFVGKVMGEICTARCRHRVNRILQERIFTGMRTPIGPARRVAWDRARVHGQGSAPLEDRDGGGGVPPPRVASPLPPPLPLPRSQETFGGGPQNPLRQYIAREWSVCPAGLQFETTPALPAPVTGRSPVRGHTTHPPTHTPSDWAKFVSRPSANQKFSLAPLAPIGLGETFSSVPLKAQYH